MTIGDFGHLMVILAFVASLVATIGYFLMSQKEDKDNLVEASRWKRFSRIAFYIHAAAVLLVIYALFNIIYNHRYEYHYAWQHSSNELPVQYMISCFWEGQEGSFLLWVFWQVVLGLIIIRTNKKWESSVMTIFSFVQFFLVSMILGVVVLNYKIGSSPFILLREAMPEIPVFQTNPDFIPENGTGLNALLQNYWMVIHPPTLFLGFALTLVPFAYAMAGLWKKRFSEWIRPALPWALVGGAILGLGILMGGYWAYETLNFGGYWNWDPVENAVYVPWLVLVASIHLMIVYRKKNAGTTLKAGILLTIATFILILYSTFLTRSGVLGNASVHSFTDLGLTGQLLIYLLTFTILSIVLVIIRWRKLPKQSQELSLYTREMWIFVGATVLCLGAFQVLIPTSIPFFNWTLEQFGIISNWAPPGDQVEFYTKWQFWFAVILAILSGTGQFFWWKKIDKEALKKAIYPPVILTFLSASVIILLAKMNDIFFIILLTVSLYSIIANTFILVSLLKKKTYKLAGGSIAHIGVAMMLIGILYSSGYSKVVSLNLTGRLYTSEEGEQAESFNRDNVFLGLNQPARMAEYQITYKGDFVRAKGLNAYIPRQSLWATDNPLRKVVRDKISMNDKTYFERGDTLSIEPENQYYKIEYKDVKGRIFNLFPRVQFNDQMGTIASPDIKRWLGRDLYTHVNYIFPNPENQREWSEMEEMTISPKDTFMIGDYFAILEDTTFSRDKLIGKGGMAIEAKVKVLGKGKNYMVKPRLVIKVDIVDTLVQKSYLDKVKAVQDSSLLQNDTLLDKLQNYKDTALVRLQDTIATSLSLPEVVEDLGAELTFVGMDKKNQKMILGVRTTQAPYVIMKALEKPLINILWIGTLVVMLGFVLAIIRRYSEFRKMRDRGME